MNETKDLQQELAARFRWLWESASDPIWYADFPAVQADIMEMLANLQAQIAAIKSPKEP